MSAEVATGGFDEIALRAVEAAQEPGATAEAEEIASKSERIMKPSMAVSMFRGRRHITANVDPGNVGDEDALDNEPMEIKPLEVEAYVPPEETVLDLGLDPVMVWKADVLRALRGASGAIGLPELSNQVPKPAVDTPYNVLVEENLVARKLVKWVVENESIEVLS